MVHDSDSLLANMACTKVRVLIVILENGCYRFRHGMIQWEFVKHEKGITELSLITKLHYRRLYVIGF